jgi:hypothetical protein
MEPHKKSTPREKKESNASGIFPFLPIRRIPPYAKDPPRKTTHDSFISRFLISQRDKLT